MIPFDWFRTKKQRLLIQQTELNNEIETLKLEESVLARRDERDKLAVRVKAHRLVRAGNGQGTEPDTGTEPREQATPRRPIHKTVQTRKEAR